MQCLNCGFENLPGLETCARCQSTLLLGDVAVVPRRASALRLRNRLLRGWYAAAGVLPALRRVSWPWRWVRTYPISWGAVFWTVLVPGTGHILEGHRRFGGWLLGLWAGFLACSLVVFGGPWHAWLLAGAIATHATALISLFAENIAYERLLIRALFGILLFLGLQYGPYRAVGWLPARWWVPLRVPDVLANPVISAGDGVLYQGPWLRPAHFQRGDVVVYRIPPVRGAGYVVAEGFGLDRIVGLPGDRICLQDGVLLVNGVEPAPEHRPLGQLRLPPDFRVELRDGHYLILPSTLSFGLHGGYAAERLYASLIEGVSIVSEQDVLGRVVFRTWPWSRFGHVR